MFLASLLSSSGWPAILGILWLVEASLHLCLHLHVFSLDVYLYPNFPLFIGTEVYWIQFSSVAQPCPTLCDPMDCSRPGLPVQHQLTGLGTPIPQYGLPWWLRGKESTCQCRRRGFDPWVRKIPLKKEIATHFNILAWEIPWIEEPGELQFMRLESLDMA